MKYRSDIDGLRAIAVLSVIVFHINAQWLPGGFLGVDVFFVISGYLITLLLAKEIENYGHINLTEFYKRRIKRIIPALLFVLIFTFIAGLFLLAPDNLLSLSKSMTWSIFSAANIYFYTSINTGYFAEGSAELPLLHLWSLGVEEQFYIIWPFLTLLLLKYLKSLPFRLILVGTVLVISLFWAQTIHISNHSFAYYMLPTRAWELLAGGMAALVVHNGFFMKKIAAQITSIIAIIVIILSLAYVSESNNIPGIGAAPITFATAFLLLAGASHQTWIGKLLSMQAMVMIGLLSYSAYLWHWPLLAYLRYALIEIQWFIGTLVLLATFIMAIISYNFIEKPFRHKTMSTKKIFRRYFVLPSLFILFISIAIGQAIKHKSKLLYNWGKYQSIDSFIKPIWVYDYNCQYSNFDVEAYTHERCTYPKGQKANVFLIGDSNAAHYLGMLRVFSDYYGFSLRNATQSACPLLITGDTSWANPKFKSGCDLYRQTVFDEALNYSTIIIGGTWEKYDQKGGKDFREQLEKTILQLATNVDRVIILGKVPTFSHYNRECEIRAIRFPWLNCSTLANIRQKDHLINIFLQNISNKIDNVFYFDVREQLCEGENCSPYLNNKPVYYDKGHLSMTGSRSIGEFMIEHNASSLNIFNQLKP